MQILPECPAHGTSASSTSKHLAFVDLDKDASDDLLLHPPRGMEEQAVPEDRHDTRGAGEGGAISKTSTSTLSNFRNFAKL